MAAALGSARVFDAFAASAARECAFLRRNPWDLALATWLPLLLLAILAWLFNSGVPRELPVAVVDDDRSAMSRQLLRMLDAAPAVKVIAQPPSLSEAWPLARSLDVYAVVHIPRDASREVQRGGQGTVLAYYNASYLTAGQAAVRDIGSVIQAFGARVAFEEVARSRGTSHVRPAPIVARATTPSNAARSYEFYLLGLLFPGILHFALCLSAASSLGRELRDRTVGSWLRECGNALVPAVAGKLAPYVLLFTLMGSASLIWLAAVRAEGVSGSATLLILGQLLMYLAYAAVALLLVGVSKNMGSALSLVSLYAGTSVAYSGVTFPLEGGSMFARAWNQLLPFTAYVELQAQQLSISSPSAVSLLPIAALSVFVAVPGALGLRAFGTAARDPSTWGR